MKIISKLLSLSSHPFKGLYPKLDVTIVNPDTGVTIVNKAAYFVIRDSAKLAKMHIPLFIYKDLGDNPLKVFIDANIVTKTDITELCSNVDEYSRSFYDQLVSDARLMIPNTEESIGSSDLIESTEEDIYGSYGSDEVSSVETSIVDDKSLLIKAFGLE